MVNTCAIAVVASIVLAFSGRTLAQIPANREEEAVRKFVLEEIERWWNSNGPLVADRYTTDSNYVDVNGEWTT